MRRALEVSPATVAYLDSLGWPHFRRGDLDDAEKYLVSAAQKLPEIPSAGPPRRSPRAQGRLSDAITAGTKASTAMDRTSKRRLSRKRSRSEVGKCKMQNEDAE